MYFNSLFMQQFIKKKEVCFVFQCNLCICFTVFTKWIFQHCICHFFKCEKKEFFLTTDFLFLSIIKGNCMTLFYLLFQVYSWFSDFSPSSRKNLLTWFSLTKVCMCTFKLGICFKSFVFKFYSPFLIVHSCSSHPYYFQDVYCSLLPWFLMCYSLIILSPVSYFSLPSLARTMQKRFQNRKKLWRMLAG